jgi:YD repeat-containing protein
LVGALGSGGQSTESLGYDYDPAWNLNWLTNAGTPDQFQVDTKNELTNALAVTVGYDPNGNPTNWSSGFTYTYDNENRLTEISDTVNHTFQTVFVYDGLGRLRIRQEYVYANSGGR